MLGKFNVAEVCTTGNYAQKSITGLYSYLWYRLKHVRDSRLLKFLPELLELSVYIAWFSVDVVNQDH